MTAQPDLHDPIVADGRVAEASEPHATRGGELADRHVERNARIDGLRGISVGLVVAGHVMANRLGPEAANWLGTTGDAAARADLFKAVNVLSIAMAHRGVDIFFIISGYLITVLLKRECDASGRVNLPAFYTRRVFRTLPAFWTFVACTYLAAVLGYFRVEGRELVQALTFQCNMPWSHCSWWLGHTWSLAVEEQFYLAWPLLLAILRPSLRLAASVLLFSAMLAGSLGIELLQPFVPISAGVVLGCMAPRRPTFGGGRCLGALSTLSFLLLFAPALLARFPVARTLFVLAAPLFLTLILIATLEGCGILAALARVEVVRRLGLISYSVYLWQQMFSGMAAYYDTPMPLAAVLLIIPVAIASYALVEQPAIRMGRRLSERLMGFAVPADSEGATRSVLAS